MLTCDERRGVIAYMRFGNESSLFGVEKDDSFKASIGDIYAEFAGQDAYPSVEEKAANLLYSVVKNHSFLYGNKRIGAAFSCASSTVPACSSTLGVASFWLTRCW